MRKILLIALSLLLASCAAMNDESSKAARQEIANATQAWVNAYDSRTTSRIVAQYAPDAVFWGTTSRTIRNNPATITDYFANVSNTPNNRVVIGEQNIRIYGDIGLNSGTYTFNGVLPDGKPVPTAARFTFVFRKAEGRWLIVDHHSSRIP